MVVIAGIWSLFLESTLCMDAQSCELSAKTLAVLKLFIQSSCWVFSGKPQLLFLNKTGILLKQSRNYLKLALFLPQQWAHSGQILSIESVMNRIGTFLYFTVMIQWNSFPPSCELFLWLQ